MGLIVSCSALKMKYRDKLRGADSELFFLHLHGSENTLSERLIRRQGHFMKASLLKSQLETLEIPQDESKYGVLTMKPLTYVHVSSQLIKKQSRIYWYCYYVISGNLTNFIQLYVIRKHISVWDWWQERGGNAGTPPYKFRYISTVNILRYIHSSLIWGGCFIFLK